jgi:S1-C subfamily serine protease
MLALQQDLRMTRVIIQNTAPIQPENSGGPLLDMSGNVVGVVSSKINELAVARASGSLPQNVNFAIKSITLQVFLDSHSIDYDLKISDAKLETADIAEGADEYTVHVTCFQ